MTEQQFHEHRTMLANRFAAAGRGLTDFMRTDGALAAIPNTQPQQYAVVGNPAVIRALLPNDLPARRLRKGERPSADQLQWEREPGEARRWTLLLTSDNLGMVGKAGDTFEHNMPQHERVDVVEIVAGAAPVGASTVLTDEREAFKAWLSTHDSRTFTPEAYWEHDYKWKAWKARAEVAAQAGQVAVPGWKLVPEKPTETMINAFYGPLASVAVSYFDWEDGGDEAYAAMLSAAPSPAKESK